MGRLDDLLQPDVQALGDPLILLVLQIVEVMGHQLRGDAVLHPGALKLHQQAFPQVPGGDPHGIEELDAAQHVLHRIGGGMSQCPDLFQGHLQIAPLIQVADDHGPDVLGGRIESGHAELPQQVFLEGLPAGHGVLEGREVLFLPHHFGTRHVVPGVGAEIILPLRHAVGHQQFPGRLGLPDRIVLLPRLLQGRVLFQLLGDPFLEVEMGQLEQLDGLLQLGRHHQLRHDFLQRA